MIYLTLTLPVLLCLSCLPVLPACPALPVQVTSYDDDGETVPHELIHGGAHTKVTRANLTSFVYLYADFKLNRETSRQSSAFLAGFREMIPLDWIRMFGQHELQTLIGGDDARGIDLAELRRHCTYSGGFHPSQPYVQVRGERGERKAWCI